MVNELIQVAVLLREVMIDAVVAAVLYFVVDRTGVKPLVQAKARHPFTPLTSAGEIDDKVLDYCNGESEDFAKEDCMVRARKLHAEGSPWPVVLTSLQREDGVIL